MKVDHCQHHDRPLSCPSSPESIPHSYHRPEEHLPVKETSPNFRIPVGLYLRSSYVFRILSKEKDIETVCCGTIVNQTNQINCCLSLALFTTTSRNWFIVYRIQVCFSS